MISGWYHDSLNILDIFAKSVVFYMYLFLCTVKSVFKQMLKPK